jgi:retinol dehydrogenase-12
MKDKIVLITGANTGIGRVTARSIAKLGATVILACRSREKTLPVIEEIKRETNNPAIEFLELDLASLANVRKSAAEFLQSARPLHLLINNAGLAGQRGTTVEGFELAFGVNHLGHFLFTELLLERIKSSAPARIVNVASTAHYKAKSLDFDQVRAATKTVTGVPEYEVSKLANILFTKALARRLEGTGVTTYALHPGVVATDVWRRVPWPVRPIMKMFMIKDEEGAATSLYCATSEQAGRETGLYYDLSKTRTPSTLAEDAELAERLWDKSVEWTRA